MPWLKLKINAWIRLGRKLPSDKEFITPENTRIATPIFWSRFFKIKCPSIWLWWLLEEVQAATRDSVYHKNCFSRGIIATRWFRRIKPLPFLQNKDYKPCCGVVACEGKSKYLCSTLSTEAEEFPGFQWRAIPGAFSLIPPCFPREEVFSWRWGIAFDKPQGCTSIHHRIKKRSGKCTSCILDILHFLLSLPFPLPGVS